MKVFRLRRPAGLEQLRLVDEEVRRPRAGEALVRLQASSLNYHDHAILSGHIATADGRIPLSDGAGEVVEIGDGVDDFKPGDRVIGVLFPDWRDGPPEPRKMQAQFGDRTDGFAREYALVPALALTPVPNGYSAAEAATLPCAALTAWRALIVDGALRPGETVLVQGSGGVSVFALQFAKAAGATVIATSSSDAKLERLKSLGADHLINYRSRADWGRAVREITGDRGVDHVVEVGGPGNLPNSIEACAMGGHIALMGVLTGREGVIPTGLLLRRQVRLQGMMVGNRSHQLDMIRAIEANDIRPLIDSHFPLQDLKAAFMHLQSGMHFGKICIDIGG